MAFCGHCGAQTTEDMKFCPSCGKAVTVEQAQNHTTEQSDNQTYDEPMPNVQRYTPPVVPGAPKQDDIRDAQDNKIMAVLAYILFFIPLLTGAHNTSAFVKFHTNQGTVLFIAAVVYGIAYSTLTFVLAFIPLIGWLLIVILGLLSFVFLALCIAGILNALNGRMRKLPLIGGIEIIS
jgi:uncharacterized membrane protein